jgi:proliferating cell nuclear antigen
MDPRMDTRMDPPRMLLEVKTVQSQSFKILIEALRDLLTDTCIEFNDTGMKIASTDTSHCVLAHLKLDAAKFEYYHCEAPITIGVNMLNFHKIIRTVSNTDTLTLFVDAANVNHLGVRIENTDKNTKTTYMLNLMDLDESSVSIENVTFNTAINLPSVDFRKLCRDMKNIAENMEIKSIGNQIVLSCRGEFCSQETIIIDPSQGSSSSGANVTSVPGEIIQGVYQLKFLTNFCKCTNLCNTVEILLKNDYPMVIRYQVASLGELKLLLAPVTE